MAASLTCSLHCWVRLLSLLVSFLACGIPAGAQTTTKDGITWVEYTQSDGQTVWLQDDRKPALYTQDFGDCQGDSLINVTRFDASYYADNMTVQFHLGGNSALTNQSLMLYIGVFAYGETRFDLTFNPCSANIYSLCPLNSSIPIEANGIIPVAPSDVAGIPPIALTIPDFEGEVILRIFANSTESQIACFSAVMTNGATFSHPSAVGSVLGVFTFIALVSSVAVATYGQYVPETRKHYAHSLSMLVVFSVFQHIYFTGGLSVNWPSVLVAFWSNYAWSAGMIYSSKMQNSINKFLGGNMGNITMVGSAPSGQNSVDLGGGFQISQIYKRNVPLPTGVPLPDFSGTGTSLHSRAIEQAIARRDLVNSTTGFTWYGNPVKPGLPLPGNFSGFAGTLSLESIPASNAFLTGLLWFLILVVLMTTSMILLKWTIEALARMNVVKAERCGFFREHWLGFTGAAILRACFIAFFMMMYLTMFQFVFTGPKGVIAIAAIIFLMFFVGMFGFAAYATFYGLRSERFRSEPERYDIGQNKAGFMHWYGLARGSKSHEKEAESAAEAYQQHHVHDDEVYIRRFGWLASRFRRSKWWFFSFWLAYEFIRACFYGGAAGHPLTQVFGLLAVEIIGLIAMVLMRPFESNRLNLIMVYLLGFSKVATVALSSAFDNRFRLARISTTVIGVVIIVIQGLLTICLMVAIVIGAISSYMSITRNKEEMKPRSWNPMRTRFYKHIDQKATDQPPPPPPPPPPEPVRPAGPYFAVTTVRREPKIEDGDADVGQPPAEVDEARMSMDPNNAPVDTYRPMSRSQSTTSRNSTSTLPYGARRHRTSWSTRDFEDLQNGPANSPFGMNQRMSIESTRETSERHRSASLQAPSRDGTSIVPLSVRPDTSDLRHGETRRHRRSTSGTYPPRPGPIRNPSAVNEEHGES